MIRRMAIVIAAAALSGGFAWHPPAARAAPPVVQQGAPDAVSPAAPPAAGRKSQGSATRPAAGDNVMRDGDTPSLIARLPWWRPSGPPASDPGELESPILTACDVWLGFPFATADAQSLTVRLAAAQHTSEIEQVANKIRVADAAEINEIDMAAPEEPKSAGGVWLSGLLALVGGALAAFSAVRYLVA
jgi:hypothetical protein